MRETQVRSLGREDLLEKEIATHSSILAWRIPWTEELGGLQSTGRKESETAERHHFHFHFPWWLMMLTIFKCPYWLFVYFFGEMSIQILRPLLTGLPFYFWVVRVLTYFRYKSLIYMVCRYFLPFCSLSLHLLSLETQTFLIYMKSN